LFECEHALVEDLRCTDREQREVDHCGSPQFAVECRELKPKTAPRVRPVGLVRLRAIKGKASDYRHAPRFKDGGLGETDPVAIALEESGNSESLRMIASEPGMDAANLLEPVDELGGCWRVGAELRADLRRFVLAGACATRQQG